MVRHRHRHISVMVMARNADDGENVIFDVLILFFILFFFVEFGGVLYLQVWTQCQHGAEMGGVLNPVGSVRHSKCVGGGGGRWYQHSAGYDAGCSRVIQSRQLCVG